ncbi:hypothetical protein LT493_04740 [Streptomyces tricolor]|nr:hypothetical protein [Streptomyces tricolor]
MLVRQHPRRPAPLHPGTRHRARRGPRPPLRPVAHRRTPLGVRDGRLTLHTLGGTDLPAPEVVCVRQVAGPMHTDREVTLLRHLERMGSTLINSLDAQLKCRNKIWQLQELALAGLPVPDTLSYATAPPRRRRPQPPPGHAVCREVRQRRQGHPRLPRPGPPSAA